LLPIFYSKIPGEVVSKYWPHKVGNLQTVEPNAAGLNQGADNGKRNKTEQRIDVQDESGIGGVGRRQYAWLNGHSNSPCIPIR
jgi:hypothetical protein